MMAGSGFYKQAGPTDLRISAPQVVVAGPDAGPDRRGSLCLLREESFYLFFT